MGIHRSVAELIVREHRFRPLAGDILLIARQTMHFTPSEAIRMVQRLGVLPSTDDPESLDIDKQTRAGSRVGGLVTDAAFFQLLGAERIKCLDHSAYEGADIIHDLNGRIPVELAGCCDFILDGSTIDNVFDPAQAIRNFAELLRPGGRIVGINMASNHSTPYVIASPYWYADFFMLNRWPDLQIYYCTFDDDGNVNCFRGDLEYIYDEGSAVINPTSPFVAGIVMFAEKGPNSTWDRCPSQHHYRSASEAAAMSENLQGVVSSPRPALMRSVGRRVCDVPRGFVYVPPE